MSYTVDTAAELGCAEMTTFVIEETDLTIGFDPSSSKGVTVQIEQTWDSKTKNAAGFWFDARTARRIARALMDAAEQADLGAASKGAVS